MEEEEVADTTTYGSCPYCRQDIEKGVCRHWVASLDDDSNDARDTATPLYLLWSDYCNERHDEMIACFDRYFEAVCALCEQFDKEGPRKRKAILNHAKKLPSTEAAILRQATKILDDYQRPREDFETIPNLLSELGPQMKIFFTELFRQARGKPTPVDWILRHNRPGGLEWTWTHYWAEDAEKCIRCITQQSKKATDRLREMSGKG